METDRSAIAARGPGGVTSRLIALFMVPVTVMCLLAGSSILSHRSAVQQAVTVEEGTVELGFLVALRDALHEQATVAAYEVRFAQLGVESDVVSTFLGFDVTAEAMPARAEADRAIRALGDASPVDADALEALYGHIDESLIGAKGAEQRLRAHHDAAKYAMARLLDRLEANARETPLVVTLQSLRAAIVLDEVGAQQIIDLSAIWIPAPADSPRSTATVLSRFGAESAEYAAATAQIRALGLPSAVAPLDRLEGDAEVRALDAAVAATLRGESLPMSGGVMDEDKVGGTFRGSFARDVLLDRMVTAAVAAVRADARAFAASERREFATRGLGTAALALASISIALVLARSISKPLKDLAGYAHAVNEGDLDAVPASRGHRGPRETRVAFRVFTDLVANLQLLDAKANALAQCDFDDPVLSEPLPGRLGRSLESSVAVLSGSIVERDELQTHLAHQATHDSLTGIYNRPAAITGIEAAMSRASRTGAPTALLFVDLNQFKTINDSHGHEVGDEVLRQVATRMTVGLRGGDFAARLGGDEFVIVAEGIGGVEDATELARRMLEAINQPIEVGAFTISVGAAVGIAMSLDGPEDPLRLLARADAAMYRAKHHERSAIEIFDAELQRQMVEREDVESALSAALADPSGGGLQLHYQPVLDATSGAMAGAEALIRWDRPDHGRLAPDSFIPIAEATSLIVAVDCWVLSEAARQLVAWSSTAELADIPVSVNISGRHLLSRELPKHIAAVLEETGINPRRLSIELTETVLLTDLALAATELHAVRALGVRVAIDDFGTGYTSLAHLQQLPIDTIKIDRSFISQLNVRRGSSLVRMVTDLGHAIDINIVAEGVETDAEMSALQAMGADHLQGFLLSRPLEAEALSEWASQHNAALHAIAVPA